MKSVVCRRRRRAKEVAGLILLADWHVTCLSNNTINKLCTDTGVQVTLLLTSTLFLSLRFYALEFFSTSGLIPPVRSPLPVTWLENRLPTESETIR